MDDVRIQILEHPLRILVAVLDIEVGSQCFGTLRVPIGDAYYIDIGNPGYGVAVQPRNMPCPNYASLQLLSTHGV
jgi:hypothetical protein